MSEDEKKESKGSEDEKKESKGSEEETESLDEHQTGGSIYKSAKKSVHKTSKLIYMGIVFTIAIGTGSFFLGNDGMKVCKSNPSICLLVKIICLVIAIGCVLAGIMYFFRADRKKLDKLRQNMFNAPFSVLGGIGTTIEAATKHPFGYTDHEGKYHFSAVHGSIPHMMSKTGIDTIRHPFRFHPDSKVNWQQRQRHNMLHKRKMDRRDFNSFYEESNDDN